MEEIEEVGDFVIGKAEVAEVIVVHGFGVVGDAPAFGFEVAFVVEFEHFAEGGDGAVVEVGGGECDITEGWCTEFTEVIRVLGDGKEAGVFFADGGCAEVVVAEVGEKRLRPILGFEEVAVGTAGGGSVDFKAAFLRN